MRRVLRRNNRALGSLPCSITRLQNYPIAQFCPRSFMLKSDRWIRKMSREHDMINPFSEKQVREGVISYGLSSYGYDLRVADEFKIFTNVNNTVVDPKKFDEKSFVNITTDICIIPPNSFALARSVEYFKIPRDVLTICVEIGRA